MAVRTRRRRDYTHQLLPFFAVSAYELGRYRLHHRKRAYHKPLMGEPPKVRRHSGIVELSSAYDAVIGLRLSFRRTGAGYVSRDESDLAPAEHCSCILLHISLEQKAC